VFSFLGAVHVFWALGGRLGFVSAIPEVNGQRAFTPTRTATFAVAFALFVASVLVLGRAGVFSSLAPAAFFKWPVIVMGLIFLVRGVGDVKLVGLFKRVRGTSFARWDTWLFSPLCLGISLAALWLGFL
jgi:quinol-cytochrome oxidoreductase complex cytochrome b subunit